MLDMYITAMSSDGGNKPCSHKWVMYTPFRGEPYECCANVGCGITKAEYFKVTSVTEDLRPGQEYGRNNGNYGLFGWDEGIEDEIPKLAQGKLSSIKVKDHVVCPVISEVEKTRIRKMYGK